MRRVFRSVLIAFFVALALTCTVSPASAAESSQQTVKVGVYGNSIYAYQDDSGVWRGIDIECLTNIAQREGLDLEFIDSVNDPDFLSSLENGTYDVLTDVIPTPERTSRFLFSESSVGSASSANLAVRADDGRWDYGNIEQVSQMRVGVVTSFSNDAVFRAWCAERGLTPQFVEYDSIGDMSAALAAGQIDGEVYGSLYGDAAAIRTVLQLAPVDLYFVFRTDEAALKNKFDQAMVQIRLEDPYYLSDLNSKYVVQRSAETVSFSNAEQAYVADHQTVTIAVVKNDEPYYWKTSDGQDAGILPDYYALVAERTGLEFRFVVCDNPDAEISAVRSGEADAIGLYANGIISADRDGLLTTENYTSTTNVLLTRTGTNSDQIHTIAVNQRSADVVGSTLSKDFSSVTLRSFGSASECFEALEDGKVDAIVCGLPSATWLMNQTNSANFSVTPLTGASSEFCAAVNSQNRTLCTLLSKGISTSKTSYDGIVTRDTLPSNDLRSLLERIPATWLALLAGVLFALVIFLVVALIQLRRRQKERAAIDRAKAENERRELEVAALARNAEEKNMFFSNISHDMRTPLNAIIGFSEYAGTADIGAAEKDEYFTKITISGKLLLDLINDTLTLSKASSGKLSLVSAPVYTEDIGAEVAIPIYEVAAQKGVDFKIDKSGYRPRTVLADSLSLQKIFLNLLSNAIKYTPRGGEVRVTVVDDPAGSDDPDLLFTVRDDGIGISKEFLPHLFEPFATEARAGVESTGTGLGLSIVKQLVDLMGGTIDVASEVGVGTTFTIRLHLPEVDADVPRQAGEETPSDFSLEGRNVLLCEDNGVNAEVAGLILRGMGITYDVAVDGREGVDLFEKSPEGGYDAVLMDVRMPIMDGIEATKAIRVLKRDDADSVPIIALTADAFEDDERRNLEAGMDAHVSKPIDPHELESVLAREIRKSRP